MTVADNIKASDSEMCKIYMILYRQKQAVNCDDSVPKSNISYKKEISGAYIAIMLFVLFTYRCN